MRFRSEVVYRRYRYNKGEIRLVISREYKKIMKIIGIAIKDNKEIIFNYILIDNNFIPRNGTWYDKVTVEIND